MSPTTKEIGQRGETLARQFLETKGLHFVAANWRCKMGEIDLIMKDPIPSPQGVRNLTRRVPDTFTLVFVEVRLRRPTLYGEGSETVAWQKQRKLINTAKFYQQHANYWGNLRFDVVSIATGTPPTITHIPDAFTL